jgi:DNA repair exonuclease SbcCD ATPase subunit
MELDDKIIKTKYRLDEKNKLLKRIEKAEMELNKTKIELIDYKDKLDKEYKDVEKLENLSISSIFYNIIGSKENKLHEERKEYLEAKYKYETCKHEVENIKRDIDYMNKLLKDYIGIEEEYEELIKEKTEIISNSNDENSKKIEEIFERIKTNSSYITELNEAIKAGENALTSLEKVIESLKSARNYGLWDMFGGGMLSTMLKRNKMDEANQLATYAQHDILKFQAEMQDVNIALNSSFSYEGFGRFADYFFDGLFVDWIVQNGINKTLDNTVYTYNEIERLLSELRIKLKDVEQNIQRLEEEKNTFIK